jgi:hypothetical protein
MVASSGEGEPVLGYHEPRWHGSHEPRQAPGWLGVLPLVRVERRESSGAGRSLVMRTTRRANDQEQADGGRTPQRAGARAGRHHPRSSIRLVLVAASWDYIRVRSAPRSPPSAATTAPARRAGGLDGPVLASLAALISLLGAGGFVAARKHHTHAASGPAVMEPVDTEYHVFPLPNVLSVTFGSRGGL